MVECAAVNDAGLVLVQTTYGLEAEGFLVVVAFDILAQ